MCDRLMRTNLPAPNPSHHPPKKRRTPQRRKPGHPLLFSSSHSHPPARPPNRPPQPTPQTTTTTTRKLDRIPTPHQPHIPRPIPTTRTRPPGIPQKIQVKENRKHRNRQRPTPPRRLNLGLSHIVIKHGFYGRAQSTQGRNRPFLCRRPLILFLIADRIREIDVN